MTSGDMDRLAQVLEDSFRFPDRADPFEGTEFQPPRIEGEPRDDRDAVAILLCDALKDAKGLHAETMLTAAGALVGCAASAAVAQHAAATGVPRAAVFHDVQTTSGDTFAFSDAVNRLLFEGAGDWGHLWLILAHLAGALKRPVTGMEPSEWARHFAASLGKEGQGVPLLTADQHGSAVSAFDAAGRFWPEASEIVAEAGGDPFDQYARFAMLAAGLLVVLHDVVPADHAASHIMQAAMATAKIPVAGDDERDGGDASTLFSIVPPLPELGQEADLSLIADPHYPYAPEWADATLDTSPIPALLTSMDGGADAVVHQVQRAPAPFWNGAGDLWRVQVESGEGRSGRLYVLQVEQKVFLLAFAGEDLDEITAHLPPVLTSPEIAADWFRFRFGFGGPLIARARLMESREQLCLTEPLGEAEAAGIDAFLSPLAPKRTGEGWMTPATMLIDDRLAKVELIQHDSGELEARPVSTPGELPQVPALDDPFRALVAGPFIPDLFTPRRRTTDADLEDDLPPNVFGTDILWREASSEQREAFLAFLAENGCPLPGPTETCRVRHAALSFYPRLALCEVTHGEDGLDVLVDVDASGSDAWFAIDGSNNPIFRANERHLVLTPDTVCDYATYFFAHVKGPHGRMPLLRNAEAIGLLEESDPAAYARLAPFVPPVVTAADDESIKVGTVMLFQDALFRAVVRFQPDGAPQVLEREMTASLDDPAFADD